VYICLCHGITDTQIRSCVAGGARTLCDLSGELGVATQCGNCANSACELMREVLHAPPPSVSNLAPAL
jgi:bacterioferritin-associated ferredoxin